MGEGAQPEQSTLFLLPHFPALRDPQWVTFLTRMLLLLLQWAGEHPHGLRPPISQGQDIRPRDKGGGLKTSYSKQGELCSGPSSLAFPPDISEFGINI